MRTILTVCLFLVISSSLAFAGERVVFQGRTLKADSSSTAFSDSAGNRYLKVIVRVETDGTLSLENGVVLFPTGQDWLTESKKKAVLTLLRAKEIVHQALEELK